MLSDISVPDKKTLPSFDPPPRFGTTTFDMYKPQHPSQQKALEATKNFVTRVSSPAESGSFRFPWQAKETARGNGLYLDGGFGVGKTHLLASAYAAFDGDKKVYLSFSELVHAIGVLGMKEAKVQLGEHKLYCIDEFELDDPGNTLIVKTFLAHVFERGGFVMTTSNTPPEAQGQGRFNASDFKREIQSIAERFTIVLLEGPDYRKRETLATLLGAEELESLKTQNSKKQFRVETSWQDLFEVLASHHPIRYGALLEQIDTLYIEGARPIETQNDALRFVHFIDKLYDLKVGLRMSGSVELENLFDPSYRDSAYAKKHYRCLSRISELLEEPL